LAVETKMLTYHETVRQLVRRLYSRQADRVRVLARRAVVRGPVTSVHDFRRRRRESRSVIERALHHLVGLKKVGALDAADRAYALRRGPASIDLIMDAAVYDGPPPLRRTCSPRFSVPCPDAIEFGDWELSDTDDDGSTSRPRSM